MNPMKNIRMFDDIFWITWDPMAWFHHRNLCTLKSVLRDRSAGVALLEGFASSPGQNQWQIWLGIMGIRDTPKFQFGKVRMMLTMLNHGIPYVSLSQSLSRLCVCLCRRTAFHFVEHSSTTRLHSTFDKYYIYNTVWTKLLMWYGDNYLDLETRYFRRLLLGLCFRDLVAMFVNSIMVPNTVLSLWWNELSRYFVAVHRSRTKGFIMQNHVF